MVGSVIYGVSDSQSGKAMHQYKTVQTKGLVRLANSLASVAVKDHFDCASVLLGAVPSQWATVPSLKSIGSDHPLRKLILSPMLGEEYEIRVGASALAAGKSEQERREFNPGLYELHSPVSPGGHVLLIDDTWTTGGHIQSVAALLKQNGAAKVGALTVARWLDMNDPRTKRVYTERIKVRPYDPDICPWTGGQCPPR